VFEGENVHSAALVAHIKQLYLFWALFLFSLTNFLMLSYQIPDFVSAKADFGTDLAISTRTELDPGDTAGHYAT
jgi:hypothetical protein